ncbi:tryptophan synthase subunit alpha [Staphylococcus simiae]|uniref:Tryptophan synthase alpha chain n=1 Tax=Staphylococcus simiae CCM 7213 = CCUG 51256 TaxID=911238 RepID=G5JGQ8_9STAP|nr:tryptophan synthase subunit alpha [Staphylococcus simiae]EHJ08633.1 tryptophan synthase subunit alpha [Staphylococcus simiae CCM 7213 = CCUG 51256]SNV70940.1 tryptophan synthase subunit alpha [Staphylococcus simiae]
MAKLFIPYIMATKNFIHHAKLLSDNGADIIEIGVPFSDPVADGPIIMEAGQQAIKEGVTINYIFEKLEQHKKEITAKYVLMTYYNIICNYGEAAFMKKCQQAGVYGLIIPDLPFELTEQLRQHYSDLNIKIISLVAMTTDKERMSNIINKAEGFIYTVTMNAITGSDGKFHPKLKQKIKNIKEQAKVPVVAGFGIKTVEHVKDIIDVADGVVIGSEIVKRFEEQSQQEIINYLNDIANVLNTNN